MEHGNEWLLDGIATGLQKLACLSLDRTPAAEVLSGTAGAWLEALTEDRAWDEHRDSDRVRRAFVKLALVCRRWPSVPEFLDALPPVPAPLALARDFRPASPDVARQNAERIIEMLGETVKPMPSAKVERETTPEQRARIEAELGQHYDRKRAAGGDQ